MDMATTINTKALINELEWVDRFTEKKTTTPAQFTVPGFTYVVMPMRAE